MARFEPESGFRRVWRGAIMWAILAGTLGLAALTNEFRHARLRVDLEPPVHVKNISIRLPANWTTSAIEEAGQVLAMKDEDSGRVLIITMKPPKPMTPGEEEDPWEITSQLATVGKIPLGGANADLMLQRYPTRGGGVDALTAERKLDDGNTFRILLIHPSRTRRGPADPTEVDLIKRIAASVEFE